MKYRLKRKVKVDESKIPTVFDVDLNAVTPADTRREIEAAISEPENVMTSEEIVSPKSSAGGDAAPKSTMRRGTHV